MKLFGVRPLTSISDTGLVKCEECGKPILRSFMVDHAGLAIIPLSHVFTSHLLAENCALILSGGKKGVKGKLEAEGKSLSCLFISNFINVLGTQILIKPNQM